tara:strand:- start:127 stop:627 length:501 start_codon:yes stop_codon:yes gene_type:complete
MKQTTQMVDHYTATVFLQKENAGDVESATKLIDNISEMPKWFNADGTPMKKGAGLGAMMKGYKEGGNGSRRKMEAYAQVFGKSPSPSWNGSMDVYTVLEQAMIEGGKSHNHVYGTQMRKLTVGDTISIQEWSWYAPEGEIQGRVTRHYMISETGFEEYSYEQGGFF